VQLKRTRSPAAAAGGGARIGSGRHTNGLGGGTLLVSDLRTLALFVNEARYRTLQRVLGLPRDQANLATAIAVVAIAGTVRERAGGLRIPGPSFGQLAFGSAALKELILGPPKPGTPPVPMFTGLVAVAAGGTLVVALAKSSRGVSAASRAFVRRYGPQARRVRGAISGRARRRVTGEARPPGTRGQ
jgi:hypothetical protein